MESSFIFLNKTPTFLDIVFHHDSTTLLRCTDVLSSATPEPRTLLLLQLLLFEDDNSMWWRGVSIY